MPQLFTRHRQSSIYANLEEELAEEDQDAQHLGPPNPWELPWAELLPLFPSLKSLAKWDEIDVDEWPLLMGHLPELENRCPWREFLGSHWAELLRQHPEFASRCDWSLLIGSDWAELLAEQPHFASLCRWESLRGPDWARLLSDQPSLAERCPWARLRAEDWLRLLMDQPQFAEFCPWEEVRGQELAFLYRHEWLDLLSRQLQFARHCPPDLLSREDWRALAPVKLRECPDASRMPDLEERDNWNARMWLAAVEAMPSLLPECPWGRFTSAALLLVLTEFPQFSPFCDLTRLQRPHWRHLLILKPEFASACPWARIRFTPYDWLRLLAAAPQLSGFCAWDWRENELSPHQWLPLIRRRPEFAVRWPLLQGMLAQVQEASR
ncbi:MAG: hypothetical protein RL095_851 [Verrucomicrobiota bacterium]|jgi:hypothetical protein